MSPSTVRKRIQERTGRRPKNKNEDFDYTWLFPLRKGESAVEMRTNNGAEQAVTGKGIAMMRLQSHTTCDRVRPESKVKGSRFVDCVQTIFLKMAGLRK